jgi:hypothetical protein
MTLAADDLQLTVAWFDTAKELARSLFKMVRRGDDQASIEAQAYPIGHLHGLISPEIIEVIHWVAAQKSRGEAA